MTAASLTVYDAVDMTPTTEMAGFADLYARHSEGVFRAARREARMISSISLPTGSVGAMDSLANWA